MKFLRIKRMTELLLLSSIVPLMLSSCGNRAKDANAEATSAASQAKIYGTEDVDKELKEGMVVLGATREDAQAFFKSHDNFKVCQDSESFSVAVVRNKKVDPRADDIYVITNYSEGKVSGMDVGPPQFSVNNPASYCK